ncbi:MAG: hypothetical protein U5K51_02250 [Flavobacteriaceae bacterium]|nr:hypothetical protein [Flavobacteriaceae bacterium]
MPTKNFCLGACLPAGRAELVDLPAGRQARWDCEQRINYNE